MRKRKIIIPFEVENKTVCSLRDLKEILAERPHLLIKPLKYGKLRKFLEGIGDHYLKCLDENNPEKSLKELGKLLGINVDLSLPKIKDITTPKELKEAINLGNEKIKIGTGEFIIDELNLDYPVTIVGKGIEKTKLVINKLKINSKNVHFKNLTLEVLDYKSNINPNFEKVKFIHKKDEDILDEKVLLGSIQEENISLTDKVIFIRTPIEISNKKIFFRNVKFYFEKEGSLLFTNCECEFANCLLIRNELLHSQVSNETLAMIWFDTSSSTINKCLFQQNADNSDTNPLSIAVVASNSHLILNESYFLRNSIALVSINSGINLHFSSFKENINSLVCGDKSSLEVNFCEYIGNIIAIELENKTNLKIYKTIFNNNTLGIIAKNDSEVEIHNCSFSNNVSSIKENIYLKHLHLENKVNLYVSNSEFHHAHTGLWLTDKVTTKIERCKFIKHFEEGIYVSKNSNLFIQDSLFKENTKGIWISNDSTLELNSVKFSNNEKDIVIYPESKAIIKNSKINKLINYTSKVTLINSEVNEIFNKDIEIKNSEEDSGPCFITTAVCLSLGKGDNCYELNTFRSFRDNWLINQPNGKELIEEYYKIAPKIVKAINNLNNSQQIYLFIWKHYLKNCLQLIENQKYEEAKNIYIKMVNFLKKMLGI